MSVHLEHNPSPNIPPIRIQFTWNIILHQSGSSLWCSRERPGIRVARARGGQVWELPGRKFFENYQEGRILSSLRITRRFFVAMRVNLSCLGKLANLWVIACCTMQPTDCCFYVHFLLEDHWLLTPIPVCMEFLKGKRDELVFSRLTFSE